MTLLGNSVEMSRQEENDPFIGNKRSKRSMRDRNQRLHQEGSGSRIASHAVHTPPIDTFFSLFTCPYRISQQSHESAPTGVGALFCQSALVCQSYVRGEPTEACLQYFHSILVHEARGGDQQPFGLV